MCASCTRPPPHICGVCNTSLPSAERLATHALKHNGSLIAPLHELKVQEAQAVACDREVRELRAVAWRKAIVM